MNTAGRSGVSPLLREAAGDLGHLVGQHVKVAQLALKADLLALERRVRITMVFASVLVLGYALMMAGLAVLIGNNPAVGIPLVGVGLAHAAGGSLGLVFASGRKRGSILIGSSANALADSVESLRDGTARAVDGRDAS